MNDTQSLRPSGLAHVVFRTANIRSMVDFWVSFLGADIVFQNDFIVFLRYDEEHHRVAIINEDNIGPRSETTAGFHHVAFTYNSVAALFKAYETRQKLGIQPTWCVNHGPTTSVYYKDPDGNRIETQVDNYDTVDEANQFMGSQLFAENPIGTDIDPTEMLRRLAAGEDEKTLKTRVEIGPRTQIPGSA